MTSTVLKQAEKIRLVVPGKPVPLQRSRTQHGKHYLPARSKTYRLLVQAEWMVAGRPALGDVLFAASLRFYGAHRSADLDNLCKAIFDALNTLAYTDDSQLTCLAGCHKLSVDERGPRAEIDLWAVGKVAQ